MKFNNFPQGDSHPDLLAEARCDSCGCLDFDVIDRARIFRKRLEAGKFEIRPAMALKCSSCGWFFGTPVKGSVDEKG